MLLRRKKMKSVRKIISLVLMLIMVSPIGAFTVDAATEWNSMWTCGTCHLYHYDNYTDIVPANGESGTLSYAQWIRDELNSDCYYDYYFKGNITLSNCKNFFLDSKYLTFVDFGTLDTSSVTTMNSMFRNCYKLTTINALGLDTSNVTDMTALFFRCDALESLDLSTWDMSSCTKAGGMFSQDYTMSSIRTPLNVKIDVDLPGTYYDSAGNAYKHLPKHLNRSILLLADKDGDFGGEEPGPGEEEKIHADFTTIHGKKSKTFSGDDGFYYEDAYFYEPSTTYNHNLATMSLCMAFSTYGYMKDPKSDDYTDYDKNVRHLMKTCGFDDYEQYHICEKPEAQFIGCAISSKELYDGTPLIAVAVRGGGYDAEWASNFSVGSSGEHYGFDQGAEGVKDFVISYMLKHGIGSNAKIWITGFSRGAAVATQAAAKLDNLQRFDKEQIYAYGFATPAGAEAGSNPHSEEYSNIFNIIEYNDPVPMVAPKKWGFDRYGKTMIFPYKESNNDGAYSKYINRIIEKMKSGDGYKIGGFTNYIPYPSVGVTISSFNANVNVGMANPLNHDTQGTVLRKTVKALSDVIGDRKSYAKKYEDALVGVTTGKYDGQLYLGRILDELLIKLAPEFIALHPCLTTTIASNVGTLVDTHANQEYYVYWMQLMDSNYSNSLPIKWGDPNYRIFKGNCPVDMYVYNADDEVVASIVDEIPSDDEDQEIIVSIDENGQKVAYLPVGGDYRVELKARENCTVSSGIEEFDAESGESVRVTNFETVPVAADESIVAEVPAFSDTEISEGADEGSDAAYSAEKGGSALAVESDLRGAEAIADHSYNVTLKYDASLGTAYGGGIFTEGSFANLEAVQNGKGIFEGFYINGKKCEEYSDPKNPYAIRIKVTGNIEVEARFKPCNHESAKWKVTKAATELAAGEKTRTCSRCGFTEKQVIAQLAPTLPAVKISKPKAAKKSATVKWKKLSKKKLKKIKKIEIQYSLDKNFKTGVKTKYAKAKLTSLKIKKLKSKKTYYVRLRAYTNSGGAVHVSKWSGPKKVKVK